MRCLQLLSPHARADIRPTGARPGSRRTTRTCTPSTIRRVRRLGSFPLRSPVERLTLSLRAGALEDKLANLTVEQREALEKDLAKKEKKEEQKAEKEAAKIAVRRRSFSLRAGNADARVSLHQASKIVVKRIERNKKKFVTTVNGLHHFGVDLKKAAKLLANKFGAGATVSKTPQGEEEILIQGDVSTEVRFLSDGLASRTLALTYTACTGRGDDAGPARQEVCRRIRRQD